MVKDFLKQAQRNGKNLIREFLTAENSLFHLFKLDVLETKNFLCVVVCNGSTLHLSNLHLHNVLEETTPDQIIELSLKTRMCSLELYYVVIQIINVVRDVIPNWCGSSSF